jgi:predicted nucleic acid-binding protein
MLLAVGPQRGAVIAPAQPKRYGLADALHLAAAIESGCDVFLTNDNQLATFPDIIVEELP